MSVGSRQGPSSGGRRPPPGGRRGARRAQIEDAALNLFTRHGFEGATAEQIAASAGVLDAEFSRYFTTPEAVLLSVVDDLSHATAAQLLRSERGAEPERALLEAGTAAVTAIADGRGAVPLERLVALARVVSVTRNLHRTVSARRRAVIAPALADWMGVSPRDRRLQRALVMWSAVTASAYVAAADVSDEYEPGRDPALRQLMISTLAQSFEEVMGEDAHPPD